MKKNQRQARGMRMALLLAVAAMTLSAIGCGHATPKQGPPAGVALPVGAQVATAGMASAGGEYNAVGTVQSRTTAAVAARVSGYITEMRVHVGDRVRRGEVLAVLSTPEAGEQVKQAQAGLAASTAQAQAAAQQVAAAQAQAAFAASTYKRYQELQKENSVSPQEFDAVASRYQAAEAGAASARARQQAVENQIEQARAALAQARTMSGYATLTAPFNGVVTAKNADAGALAMPGQPLLTVEKPDQLQLAVSVPDQLLGGLRSGQAVTATVDALPGKTLQVRISEITPVSDPGAHAAIVKCDLPAVAGLRSGQFGHVTLPVAGAAQPTLLVPHSAIVRQGELDEMYVLNAAGRAELRLIKTGAAMGGQVEVLAGLNAGERYVIDAQAIANAQAGAQAGAQEGSHAD